MIREKCESENDSMKVLYCKKPEQFILKDEQMPTPKKGEALIKITRIGICGTDIHAFYGKQPFFTYPRILGHELAGEVVQVHSDTSHIKVGDKVTILPYMACGQCIACMNDKPNCCVDLQVLGVHGDGGMREYITVPLSYVVKTENITEDEAAMVEPLSIGAHAVRRADLQKGETVLVIGAGPIGLAVMKFAKLQGATVIGMDLNKSRLSFCKKWANIDHTVVANELAHDHIKSLSNAHFPTAVFDVTGNKTSMNNAIHYVAHGGRLIYVGLMKEHISFHNPEFHKREMSMIGSRNATMDDFSYVISCIEQGLIPIDQLITNRISLTAMPTQFAQMFHEGNEIVKAIIEM